MDKHLKLCTVKEIKNEGVIRFRLTERIVDRDSEVIEPKGIKLNNYKKNPVMIWAHDLSGKPPVAKMLSDGIEQKEQFLDADFKFDLEDPFAAMIHNKYQKGFLNAGSIRFIPIAWDREPVLPNQKGYTITKSELLEFSAVPVPANPGALKKEFEIEHEDEAEQKWIDQIKSFYDNDNFDHTPEGWLDFMDKKDESEESESDKIPERDAVESLKENNEDESKITVNTLKWLDGLIGESLSMGIKFLDDYDFTDFKEVVKAMIALRATEELPKYIKQFVYNELVELYKQFDKEPPEFETVKELESQEDQNDESDGLSVFDDPAIVETIVSETVKQFELTEEEENA